MAKFEFRQSVSRARTINQFVFSQSNNLGFQEEEILIFITMFPSAWSLCQRTCVNYSKPYVNYSIGHSILKTEETELIVICMP